MLARVFTALLAVSAVFAHADPEADPELEERDHLYPRAPMATVYTKCSRSRQVALTFDDGPYQYTRELVNLLNSNNVKATFFVNGRNFRCIYDSDMASALLAAYNGGHQIASHTWAHRNLATLSVAQLNDEMGRVETAMEKILGVSPAMIRPPYGSYNTRVREVARSRNQSLIIWDVDSGDSAGISQSAQQKRYTDLANRNSSNALVLNHDVYASTVRTLTPHAIRVLRARNYQFVTVAQCLGISPYKSRGTTYRPGKRDSSWRC